MPAFGYHSVQTSLTGKGSLELLSEEIKKRELKRALIVTDSFLYKNGTAEKVALTIEKGQSGFGVFANVQPNPTVDLVEKCYDYAQQIEADCLVALGGGSAIDTAKAVGILCANGGNIRDYEGVRKSRNPSIPLIAVNTTAGTGSEVTSFYIVTDPKTRSKMCMVDENCMVSIAVYDCELMMTMPPSLTASTGMDALTHAIEAYLSRFANPLTDKDALWAIRTISQYLPIAYRDGKNVQAREMMAHAANIAGMAFSNSGLGMVHAMAHALGGFYNLPHGICNAVLLPYVMEFNGANKEAERRFSDIAAALGVSGARFMMPQRAVSESVRYVKSLSKSLGIPESMQKLKAVQPSDFPKLALLAQKDACLGQNPFTPTYKEIVALYEKAYQVKNINKKAAG